MKTAVIILVIIISSLVFISCNGDNPVPPQEQPQTTLALEDISCTEAWIKLSTVNISLPANVDLYRDSSLTEIISLSNTDTLLYVDSLLPNRTYNFHTVIPSYNHTAHITSNQLQVTTMDTTSHNFTWQTWTFGGQAGSCELYDVAIIDENDIWAAGEIYLLDTLGVPDPDAYNVVHWNGDNWEVIRLRFYGICSAVEFPPLKAVWPFSDTEIVVTNGAGIGVFDGNTITLNCEVNSLLNGSINKIWGTSDNYLYVVGDNGSIAHYNGHSWIRINSGTNLDINDIYGAYNPESNRWEIIAPAANVFESLDRDLLLIHDNSAEKLDTSPAPGTLRTIWFIPGRYYFLGGGGIFSKRSLREENWENRHNGVTIYSTNRIRGNGINDVVFVGGYGEILHFNGYSFQSYYDQTHLNGNYYSVDIKDNIVVAVGDDGPKAVITVGTRE